MDAIAIKMKIMMNHAKERFVDFAKKERGGSEIIAMVLVIAIVLVLAGVFWNKISGFFGELMGDMLSKKPSINASDVSIPPLPTEGPT